MKLNRPRTIAVVTGVLALTIAATAVALNPKPGLFSEGTHEGSHKSVTFTYERGKLLSFFASIVSCKEGEPAIVEKKIAVKNSGKFGYDGKASSPVGRHFHVDIEGKFTDKKHAEGTVDREDCEPMDFDAKYSKQQG